MSDRRKDLLDEAARLVSADRHRAYGPPAVNLARTAAIINAALEHKIYEPFTAADVALIMVAVKLARITHDPTKRDSWVDVAGWAACGWECAE